ncbi:hypothetical protein GCM10017691_58580 [Pseudonocardia petroleophila]
MRELGAERGHRPRLRVRPVRDHDPARVAGGQCREVPQPVVGEQVGVVDDERDVGREGLAGGGGVTAHRDARVGPGGGECREQGGLAVPAGADDVDPARGDRVRRDVAQDGPGSVGECRRVHRSAPPPSVRPGGGERSAGHPPPLRTVRSPPDPRPIGWHWKDAQT